MKVFRYQVEGMTCSACSAHVERAVDKLPFVLKVQVSLLSNTMAVETRDGQAHTQEIEQAVANAGYRAISVDTAGGKAALGKTNGAKAAGSQNAGAKNQSDVAKGLKTRFITSLAFLVPLMYISMQHMFGWPIPKVLNAHFYPMVNALAQLVLATPVLYVNRVYFTVGLKRLLGPSPNMDSLIALGSGASYIYGIATLFRMAISYGNGRPGDVMNAAMDLYFESAVMILTLITLGKFFEARAKGKTTAAIEKLIALTPDEVTVIRAGNEQRIATAQVRVEDVLLIRPGERIPVDGVLLEGQIAVDQSHITGESLPVEKKAGDELISGSMNRMGAFHMRATKVGEDTTLSQIVRLVQEAGDSKAPIAKLADKVSGIFVPIVMGVALVTFIIWMLAGQSFSFALSCAIAVLVISCPCALGLATPVAIMVGTGVGAQHGILFRNGEVLETLHHIGSIVLDKTGTITEGRMAVQEVHAAAEGQEEALLRVALTLEMGSEHPLAEAVRIYCKEKSIAPIHDMKDFLAIPGKGLSAQVEGKPALAGNRKWMEENGIALSQKMEETLRGIEEKGYSVLCFSKEGALLGSIGVSDTLKPTALAAVSELKKLHITPYLLTGDQRLAARHIASQAGIEEVMAEVLPADKAAKVQALQENGDKVAMVGDGINDAPALKQADVGIAVGTGTDIAIETADVVLASGSLTGVSTAVKLSRAVLRNIKQNLFWAFFYNIVGIPIAAGVLYPAFGLTLSPMLGAAAMSLSSVCVVSNALRLRSFRVGKEESASTQNGVQSHCPATMPVQQPASDNEEPKENDPKEDRTMEKTMNIEGMSCNHCKMSVEKALSALGGVESAQVDLEKKIAVVKGSQLDDTAMTQAVTEIGFEVKGIQ